MTDEEKPDSTTAGDAAEHRDPDEGGLDTAGGAGDGASDRDPVTKAAGGERRDPAKRASPGDNARDDDTTSDDHASVDLGDVLDDLVNPPEEREETKAEADVEEAETGDDGDEEGDDDQVSETEADDEGTDAEKDEAKDDGEKPEADAEADPDDLTEEERKRLPKKVNRQLDRLLKSKRELKEAADLGADIERRAIKGFPKLETLQTWIDTGVFIQTAPEDQALERLVDLALTVRTGSDAKKLPPEERARHLRELADRIAPAPGPKVITLPDELREAVEAKVMSQEEAEGIALTRQSAKEAKAQPPAKKPPAEPQREEQPQGPTRAEFERGVTEAKVEYRKLAAKYGPDWKRLEKDVVARVKERAHTVHPSAFAQLVRDQADIVLAKRRPASKAPPKSPAPSKRGPAPEAKADDMTDDDLLAMTIGEKEFPKRR
jgi:hypothetical protein